MAVVTGQWCQRAIGFLSFSHILQNGPLRRKDQRALDGSGPFYRLTAMNEREPLIHASNSHQPPIGRAVAILKEFSIGPILFFNEVNKNSSRCMELILREIPTNFPLDMTSLLTEGADKMESIGLRIC